jgi:hypothetical protein
MNTNGVKKSTRKVLYDEVSDIDDEGNAPTGKCDVYCNPVKKFGGIIYNISIFLTHASVSIYILYLIFQTDEFCLDGSNQKQYMESYVYSSVHTSALAHPQPKDIWPVTDNNYERDAAYTVQSGILKVNSNTCVANDTETADNKAVSDACAAAGLHQTFERTPHGDLQAILGGSSNILFIMLIFEWVSASFALFYLSWPHMSKTWRWICTVLAAIWDGILIIIVTVIIFDDRWDIPANNAIIGLFALFKTSIVHMVYTYQLPPTLGPDNVQRSYYGAQIHYLEYAISAPILMMGVQSTIILNSAIWPVQVLYPVCQSME